MYMMMLFFIIMTSGQLLVRSMLEEKSSRIVELLLSSVPRGDIMGGKIIGLGALGITQLATWWLVATLAGGLGSFSGAFFAAVVIGQLHNFGVVYVPWAATMIPFLLMMAILIWKPSGFAGQHV